MTDYIEQLRKFWGDKTKEDTISCLESAIYRDWSSQYNDETIAKGFKNCNEAMITKEALNQLVIEEQITEKEYEKEGSKLDIVIDKFIQRDDIFIPVTDKRTGKMVIVPEKELNKVKKQKGGR